MNKKLRQYSYLSDENTHINAMISAIQDELERYYNKTPVGKTYNWASGTITRTPTGADYVDEQGQTHQFTEQTGVMYMYRLPGIKKQWDSVYSNKWPDLYMKPVILGSHVTGSETLVGEVMDTQYVDASMCRNRDLVKQYIQTLELIGAEIALQFPDRPCDKLTYLDASSRTGTCVDHDTHNGIPPKFIDIQYYTKGLSNYTQRGNPLTDIWSNGALNLSVFDAERNAMLILLIAEAFTGFHEVYNMSKLAVWPDIKGAMLAVYPIGAPERTTIEDIVSVDSNVLFNHDKHMHLSLTHGVNLGMEV